MLFSKVVRMAKLRDFTDYRMAIYGAGEHTKTEIHIQFLPKKKNEAKSVRDTPTILDFDAPILQKLPTNADITAIRFNGFKYRFEDQRDRAYTTRKASWVKWIPKHPILSLKEIFRVKKIGFLICPEYCDHKCSKHPECQDGPCKAPDFIEAWHHSIIRQPSGHLRSDPTEYVFRDGQKCLAYPEYITPYQLKVKVENRLYKNQVGTVKYGIQKVFSMNWKIWLIVGVAIIGIILFLTGNIPGM
jgi:hypothetical protein